MQTNRLNGLIDRIRPNGKSRMNLITPVILCGGSGTRLWPLSRKSFSKQFVPLIGNKSLLQLTLERVPLLSAFASSWSDEDRWKVVAEQTLDWASVSL